MSEKRIQSTESVYKKSICSWPDVDRPREKLARYGEANLSNSELLAILLRTGVKGESAVDLARRILNKYKTFRGLTGMHVEDVKDIKGVGPAKIAQIKAAIEIGRRFRAENIKNEAEKIKSSKDIVNILMPQMRDLDKEVFKVVYLDASNRIIDIVDEAHGTVNFAAPIIREIMEASLRRNAVSIVCSHNHPSGDAAPSSEDRQFTRKIVDAGKIMQINVLDHLIIGNDCYYSFADSGGML